MVCYVFLKCCTNEIIIVSIMTITVLRAKSQSVSMLKIKQQHTINKSYHLLRSDKEECSMSYLHIKMSCGERGKISSVLQNGVRALGSVRPVSPVTLTDEVV